MNYYKRHIGDYIRDTVSLTMLEEGAYNRLLDQAYIAEQPLTLNNKDLYRLARATSKAERTAVDYIIGKFFNKTEAGYVQKRVSEELAEYQQKSNKAAKSANARWTAPSVDNSVNNSSERNANASPDAMRTHTETQCERNASHKPLAISHETAKQRGNLSTGSPPPADPAPLAAVAANALEAGRLAAGLRKQNVKVTGSHPTALAWARDGITLERLLDALIIARMRKPAPEPIAANYLDAIVRDENAGKPADSWYATREGIDRKAKELGINASTSDTYDTLKAKVWDRLKGQAAA